MTKATGAFGDSAEVHKDVAGYCKRLLKQAA
jgi:hypothetical protein